ncbi:small integral membrane protein 30-like [Chelmon rostratus]|uniref:small integral membrane protein 30-like n=1 Tax=Chelmon rostratus TaxID=109905 RepID=UPI001BE5B631|nr:small integral membrane protein 30-like [Chelmon rostratus]
MAPKLELPNAAAIFWLMFLSLIPAAEAYDAGDALAMLLGTVLTVVGFCACLGWYARRRNGQL